MDSQELIEEAKALRQRIGAYDGGPESGTYRAVGAKAQVCQFLRTYAGHKSSFVKQAETAEGYEGYVVGQLDAVLESFIEYVTAGLHGGVSPEHQAQIDVVSDILEQAHSLLENKDCHPAAAAVLVGASLEEFLRNWVEAEDLSIDPSKPSIDAYCKCLRSADLLAKQDVKDVTAWAGIRNDAAHGEWNQVSDHEKISLMLQGVDLFMRKKKSC